MGIFFQSKADTITILEWYGRDVIVELCYAIVWFDEGRSRARNDNKTTWFTTFWIKYQER